MAEVVRVCMRCCSCTRLRLLNIIFSISNYKNNNYKDIIFKKIMSTTIEKDFVQQQDKNSQIQDHRQYFYPQLNPEQKNRIDQIQQVLDKRFEEQKLPEKIDLTVLFDPENEKFEQIYAFEDVSKEELIQLVKFRCQQR